MQPPALRAKRGAASGPAARDATQGAYASREGGGRTWFLDELPKSSTSSPSAAAPDAQATARATGEAEGGRGADATACGGACRYADSADAACSASNS